MYYKYFFCIFLYVNDLGHAFAIIFLFQWDGRSQGILWNKNGNISRISFPSVYICFLFPGIMFPFLLAFPIISKNTIYATHCYCLLNSNFDSSIIKLCSYVLMWSTVFYYYRIWSKIKLITEYFQLIYVAVEHAYIKLNFTNSELTIVYLFLQVVVKLWTVPWDKMRFYIYRQSFACVL